MYLTLLLDVWWGLGECFRRERVGERKKKNYSSCPLNHSGPPSRQICRLSRPQTSFTFWWLPTNWESGQWWVHVLHTTMYIHIPPTQSAQSWKLFSKYVRHRYTSIGDSSVLQNFSIITNICNNTRGKLSITGHTKSKGFTRNYKMSYWFCTTGKVNRSYGQVTGRVHVTVSAVDRYCYRLAVKCCWWLVFSGKLSSE